MGRGCGRGPALDWHKSPQATISYYQLMHMQTAPLPVNFQMLCESSKLYDPGQQYASHVRQLQRGEEPDVRYDFEPYVSSNAWYLRPVQPHASSGKVGGRPGRPLTDTYHQVPNHAYTEGQLHPRRRLRTRSCWQSPRGRWSL